MLYDNIKAVIKLKIKLIKKRNKKGILIRNISLIFQSFVKLISF